MEVINSLIINFISVFIINLKFFFLLLTNTKLLIIIMVKYIYKEFKSVLNKLKFPDSWFWSRYTLNTYSGCAHACIYCDARSERYYIENFENEVIIKTDFDKKLDQRLKRARTLLPDVIAPVWVVEPPVLIVDIPPPASSEAMSISSASVYKMSSLFSIFGVFKVS